MGDYGGFGKIVKEARELDQEQRDKQPTACPNCGMPLEYNADRGLLNCPAGCFRVPGRPPEVR